MRPLMLWTESSILCPFFFIADKEQSSQEAKILSLFMGSIEQNFLWLQHDVVPLICVPL